MFMINPYSNSSLIVMQQLYITYEMISTVGLPLCLWRGNGVDLVLIMCNVNQRVQCGDLKQLAYDGCCDDK